MEYKERYTEEDLDRLINEILDAHLEADDLPNVCSIITSQPGRERVHKRIKELIINEGIRKVDSALAIIESSMGMDSDEE